MASAPSISDAFRTTLDLFQTGCDLTRQNLRRRYPDAHEHEIDRLLQTWLLERPGAEAGDCPAGRSTSSPDLRDGTRSGAPSDLC